MYIYIFSWYMSFRYIYTYIYIYKENICKIYIYIHTQSILVFDTMQVLYWPVLGLIQFCSFDRGCKTCLDTKLVLIPLQNQLCAAPKPAAPKPALCLLLNRLCIGTKPAFSFWINISTVSEVRFDCQGLDLVARNEASILVFDIKPVLYRPVLDQIQFCSFDRGFKTCLDTKPVLDQGRFCSLTDEWPWKTIGHLYCATSSFVHHFVAIGEFKLELQSGNAQFGSKSKMFLAVWPWNLTYDLEKQ